MVEVKAHLGVLPALVAALVVGVVLGFAVDHLAEQCPGRVFARQYGDLAQLHKAWLQRDLQGLLFTSFNGYFFGKIAEQRYQQGVFHHLSRIDGELEISGGIRGSAGVRALEHHAGKHHRLTAAFFCNVAFH